MHVVFSKEADFPSRLCKRKKEMNEMNLHINILKVV